MRENGRENKRKIGFPGFCTSKKIEAEEEFAWAIPAKLLFAQCKKKTMKAL